MNWRAWLIGLLCSVGALSVRAHGDLHLQIEALSAALKQTPHDATLWHKRGELYRAHHATARALADYARAEKLDPTLVVVQLSRGRVLYEAGRLRPAQRSLDQFLQHTPAHVEALLLRARVRARLGRREQAEQDFAAALALSPDPLPDLYLERAQNLAEARDVEAALRVLEQGKERLGPLATLDEAALALELKLSRHAAALRRIDAMLARVARQEHLLARKAAILDRAGDPTQAREVRQRALAQIQALPEAKQRLASTQALSLELEQGLALSAP